MQDTFFPRPPTHVTQALDILGQFNLAHKNLARHKDSISIYEVLQIFAKVGILTQENYDALLRVEDTNSVANIIDALYCSDLLTPDSAQDYMSAIFPLINPKAVAQSVCLLGSHDFLNYDTFCAAIKHPNHERCAAILNDLHNQDDFSAGPVAVVLCNQELTKRSAFSCLLL